MKEVYNKPMYKKTENVKMRKELEITSLNKLGEPKCESGYQIWPK